jgi:hypothetical protein
VLDQIPLEVLLRLKAQYEQEDKQTGLSGTA